MDNDCAFGLEMRPDNIAVLYFDSPTQKVNTFTSAVLKELQERLVSLKGLAGLRGLIITSRKPGNFCAGADLEMLLDARLRPGAGNEIARIGQDLANLIGEMPFPTLAAIDGGCVGGGLEIALACDFRVVSSNEATYLGFPEVKIGLIPGWGGTQRLPRLVGLQKAIEIITGGQSTSGRCAAEIGLAQNVVSSEFLMDEAARVLHLADKQTDWRERREIMRRPLEIAGHQPDIAVASSGSIPDSKPQGPHAAFIAREVMQKTVMLPLTDGLKIEAEAFADLLRSEVAANLMHTFLAMRRITKDTGVSTTNRVKTEAFKTVAVIGGGLMGSGIAACLASNGVNVTLVELTEELLERGMARARARVEKSLGAPSAQSANIAGAVARITPTTDLGVLKNNEFVLEAIIEGEGEKRDLLCALNGIVRGNTILASNTSTISISRLAENLDRPERFVGMHFFNPVERMQLVEVIRGSMTDDETILGTVALAKKLGKTPIVIKDCPGFLVNRLLFPYMNEALVLIEEGVSPEVIDRAAKRFGMPMGPIALHDVIGLDTALFASRILAEAYPERMFTSKFLAAVVQQGRLGQKSAAGFYRYDSGSRTAKPDPTLETTIAEFRKTKRDFEEEEIINRLFMPMLVEAIHAVNERVVPNVETVDVSLILGIGFPPSRGGIFRWADAIGAKTILATLRSLQFLGDRFKPPETLIRLASAAEFFYSGQSYR